MIEYVTGNIFESTAQVITNPINCVGVAGKGLARQFKTRFPLMHEDYVNRANNELIWLGFPYLFQERGHTHKIVMFPTKGHWRERSQLKYIDIGLINLSMMIKFQRFTSLALPALGCGLGGLDFEDVKRLIEYRLDNDIPIHVYLPEKEIE